MSDVRRSMLGAPPSSLSKDSNKSFFKANPPKRDGGDEREDTPVMEELEEESASGMPESVAETSTPTTEPTKRKRRKRRIRLTDHNLKAKRRAVEKKSEKNGDAEKTGGESPSKKEKEAEEEVVEKPSFSSYTPFQLLCDHILRKLIQKDPEEFFAHPVTPSMAPDYATIIQEPMDFMTIRSKIEQNQYASLDEFSHDVQLISENAIIYNQPNTVYYVAAQKLSVLAKYYLSRQYLEYVRFSAPFGRDLRLDEMWAPRLDGTAVKASTSRESRKSVSAHNIADSSSVDDILSASDSNSHLTGRKPTCNIGYLDNRDGALALNILTGAERSRVTLGDVVKPLAKGNPGLLSFSEPILCQDYPVSYTDPGPFASFAPQYDSTWATLSKRDSDLLLACYGDQENAIDALTLRQMVSGCDDAYVKHVDSLLDYLTDGEHSRTIKTLEGDKNDNAALKKLEKKSLTSDSLNKILDDIKSLQNIGLDLTFINDLRSDLVLAKNKKPDGVSRDEMLQRTDTIIADLARMNYERLSAAPAPTITNVAQPSIAETQLAGSVITELSNEIKTLGVKPADIVAAPSIHKSLGLNDDDDDFDYDVLREFFV